MIMIALYYCYTPYELEVEQHIKFQEEICESYNLNGRVRVSTEGINGVLSGDKEMLKQYEEDVRKHLSTYLHSNGEDEDFDFDVKYCHLRPDVPEKEQVFDSISIKQTREVVSLHEQINITVADKNNKNNGRNGKSNPWRRRRRRRKTNPNNTNNPEHNQQQHHQKKYTNFQTATHLTPEQWQQHLHKKPSPCDSSSKTITNDSDNNKILIDARNIYESNVGYFHIPGIPTILTNTRKYSSLPQILNSPQVRRELSGKDVYMYCTGGVRCERASQYLASLASERDLWVLKDDDDDDGNVDNNNDDGEIKHDNDDDEQMNSKPPLNIYQLEGGIQRYLEVFGEMERKDDGAESITSESESIGSTNEETLSTTEKKQMNSREERTCLYRGKNFVFDPRRTDPKVGPNPPGKCLICESSHDDYDNGHAPSKGKEARCCRCRVLVLVCDSCKHKVRCWGEDNDLIGSPESQIDDSHTNQSNHVEDNQAVDSRAERKSRPSVFCGEGGNKCMNQGNNLDDLVILR